MKTVRVAVTGAAGQIGYALLFRIASGQMFGPDVNVELHLLELPQVLDALRGVVMELEDCAFPLLTKIVATSDANQAFEGADWALLIGSVPRKKGMERSDLLKINGEVFKIQGQALSESAKPSCKVLVVGNPCNTNAFIAKYFAKNISEKNFFALTMLDQNRAVAQIAKKVQAPTDDIKNLIIWGNHSLTQYPNFYQATIREKPLLEMVSNEDWLQGEFLTKVQKRGAEIIQARGLSSAASAANAVIDTVQALSGLIFQHENFSVAVSSDGSYGIDAGLMFSYPIVMKHEIWSIEQDVVLNDFSQKKIQETHQELLAERDEISYLFH